MASTAVQNHLLGGRTFTSSGTYSKRTFRGKSNLPPRSVLFGSKKCTLGVPSSTFWRLGSRNGASRCMLGSESVVNKKVVGIDLGTTNFAVDAMEGGKSTIMTDEEGQRTTPSVVAYSKSGDRLVGQIAKRKAVINPENTFFSVKRFIGRKMLEVEEESKQVSYMVMRDENGNVKLECPAIGKQFAAEEISAQFLRKLADVSSRFLNDEVKKVVITVPAYFNDSQRKATKEACRIVLRILNEPTAASLVHGFEKKSNETILVFDLRGGTFDVSVLEVGYGVFEVLSTCGEADLGGDDFDKRVVNLLAADLKKNEGIDLLKDKLVLQRITDKNKYHCNRRGSFDGHPWFGHVTQKSDFAVATAPDYGVNRTSGERVAVLVIGGGGREHAICYALQRSSSCDTVFCAPGNVGISSSGHATCIPKLDVSDSAAVISFCQKWDVGLVVIGPEAPLVAGLANDLTDVGIPTFGPSSQAAALEGSKNFMKKLCNKYNIPTAKYRTFSDPSIAKQYIEEQGVPIVIKADGLASGKGVIVAMTLDEAFDAVDSMLIKGTFGAAGSHVVIEEYLEGEEASFFAIVDGEYAVPLESVQDHKRVGDGDTGPNTGGMGAYSPAPVLTNELKNIVMETIILPTVKGMAAEGCKFVGVLYAGLMIEKKSGLPKLIEYNVRFGDPECQVLMMRLESDLTEVLLAACKGELRNVTLNWSPDPAMVVVMASKGYPGSYQKGSVIRNLDEAEYTSPSIKIFHAGTDLDEDGNFIATGGRVLGVTAKGKDLVEARDKAYQAIEEIKWSGGFYRRDIGWRAL